MSNRPALLADFAARYIWWRDESPPSEDRIIAQVMSIGTYDDIRRLEAAYSASELRELMLRAQPGWISKRSWEFWRGRLRAAGAARSRTRRRAGPFMTQRFEPRLGKNPWPMLTQGSDCAASLGG